MAAVQRTRPRVGAPVGRPQSMYARVPQQQPVKLNTINNEPISTGKPLAVFLTNLRLLNLDKSPDWPDLSPAIFTSSSSSLQAHKRRIQCVEWALVKLFEIWDPEEAISKLHPFFPAADQLQSVTLRSALLKLLETAKKNNALDRDAVIRKTMLDECKGERLEELLASFSCTVLKQAVAEGITDGDEYPTPAVELALENLGYSGDPEPLKPVILAYRVSLARMLERRDEAHARYKDFNDLLALKERNLTRRMEDFEESNQHDEQGPKLSEGQTMEMRRALRNNWSGNELWMDTIMHGDEASRNKNALLKLPFDKVWKKVQQGRLIDVEDHGKGLLEQLDGRVKTQRERLARWTAFHKDMAYDRVPPSPSKKRAPIPKKKGLELKFEAHKELQLQNRASRGFTGEDLELDPEYQRILDNLKEELQGPPIVTAKQVLGPLLRRKLRNSLLASDQHFHEPISDISDLEDDEPEPEPEREPEPIMQTNLRAAKRLPKRPVLSHVSNSIARQPPQQQPQPQPQPQADHWSSVNDARKGAYDALVGAGLPALDTGSFDGTTDSGKSSPSPTKSSKPRHTLSLAERTRLSMARGSTRFLDDEEELPLGPSAANRTVISNHQQPEPEEYEDLAARTRKSMAGFEKAQQKAQLDRRRSMRQSKILPRKEGGYFPKVDEEQDQTALIERLMQEDNMEAIFGAKNKTNDVEWD